MSPAVSLSAALGANREFGHRTSGPDRRSAPVDVGKHQHTSEDTTRQPFLSYRGPRPADGSHSHVHRRRIPCQITLMKGPPRRRTSHAKDTRLHRHLSGMSASRPLHPRDHETLAQQPPRPTMRALSTITNAHLQPSGTFESPLKLDDGHHRSWVRPPRVLNIQPHSLVSEQLVSSVSAGLRLLSGLCPVAGPSDEQAASIEA